MCAQLLERIKKAPNMQFNLTNQPTFPGEDIFVKLNEFFTANELSWNNCVGVCTDGAAVKTGK
jgi:hypothetical protein